MTIRNRMRQTTQTGFRTRRWDGITEQGTWQNSQEITEDVVGFGDNQPFSSDSFVKEGGLINGDELSNRTGYNWNSYPSTYQEHDSWSTSHLDVATPDSRILASEVLKRTNPSRTSVDAVVSLLELRELPGLVKDGYNFAMNRLFKHIPRSVYRKLKIGAKVNLLVQFGLLPIYSDVTKLAQFQSLVDGRVREFERLQTRGLRRTIPLGTFNESHTVNQATIQSQGVRLKADLHKITEVELRGHIRWYVTRNFYESDSELRAKAASSVLNRSLDPQAIYELIPWSWLIDYFSNLGDFVSLTRNHVNARHDLVRIMTKTTTTLKSSNHTTSNSGRVTLTPFKNKRVTKNRRAVNAGLTAQAEFLTTQQMSILGSLSVLKGLR